MWLIEPGWEGWSTWSGAAAVATGLHYRPWEALLADLPAWEREHHLNEPASPASLAARREQELLAALSQTTQ